MKETNNDIILRYLDDNLEESEKLLEQKGQELVRYISSNDYGNIADRLDEYQEMLNEYLMISGMIGNIESDYVKRGVEY